MITQITSRDVFARKAKERELTVAIFRYITSTPVDRAGRLVMQQVVAFDYQLTFDEGNPDRGQETWFFKEFLTPDDEGLVRPGDAPLLKQLEQLEVPHHYVRRTNTF